MELLPRRSGAGAFSDDATAFQVANRCPLFRGRLNRWILRRTLVGRPTDADMLGDVAVVLGQWFSPSHVWGVGELVGNVRGLARRRTLDVVGEVAATSDFLKPVPCVLGDAFASLAVEFFYFGRAVDMPWPVLDCEGHWSPLDCVWFVDVVGLPDGS